MKAFSISIVFAANLLPAAFAACDIPRFGGAGLFGGAGTTIVATGDFNLDGYTDVVLSGGWIDATGKLQSGISVSLNNGDGTFAPPVTYTMATPNAAVVADFNGDGKPDLVLAGSSIVVMLGKGDGTFQNALRNTTGATSIAVGDFNGDGKLDLAVNNNLAILLGNGDGTFQKAIAPAGVGVAILPYGPIAVGDFNGDGKLDVVTGTPKGGIYLFAGDGKGNLSAPVTINTASPNTPAQLAVADLNGDGALDVVTSNALDKSISVLLGNGNGTFQPAKVLPVGGTVVSIYSLVVADLTADSVPDVAVVFTASASTTHMTVLLFPGNGDGTFQAPVAYNPGPNGIISLAPGDFNGDGITDLIFTDSSEVLPAQIGVIFGNGNGTLQTPVSYPVGPQPGPLVLADLNGDGALDMIVPGTGLSGNVSILLGNSDGTFQPAVTLAGSTGAGYAAVGDFNGDGKPDLAVATTSLTGASLLIYPGNGDGTFQAPKPAPIFNAGIVVIGDFNKDGKLDAEVSGQLLLGNGDGTFNGVVNIVNGGGSAAADLNGDGNLDLLAMANGSVQVMMGNGNGTFKAPVKYAASQGSPAGASFAVGDVNGDGVPDLVAVANPFLRDSRNNVIAGNIAVLINNGDGTFQPAVRYTVSPGMNSVALADFNGDGFLDLAVTSSSGSTNLTTAVTVLLGNGDGTFRNPMNFALSTGSTAIGDLNGDGLPDLVAPDSPASQVMVMLNTYVKGSTPSSACAQLAPRTN